MLLTDLRRLGAVLLVASLLGCAPVPPPAGDVAVRWIEDDPQDYLSASEMVSTRISGLVFPSTDGDQPGWRGHDVEILSVGADGLELVRSGPDPWVAVATTIETDAIVAVEVDLANPGPADVQLFWAGRWQRFSMARMVRQSSSRALPSGAVGFRFDVGDHAGWTGTVRSLRIDVAPGGAGPVRIAGVRLLGWEIDETGLKRMVSRPWKIELGRSAKSSLLTPPGTSWARSLLVPEDATLLADYGLQRHAAGATTFRIAAAGPDGASTTVFEDTLTRQDRWLRARVDLSELAGRRVTLSLETESMTGSQAARGMPVWGNPEIVTPAAGDPRPNVVIVLADTLRADRLSCYGHPLETSARIDRWAAGSAIRFTNTVAPAPWTLPSHISLFTGLDALHHGFDSWSSAPAHFDMLAEVFRRYGYTTAAFTGGGVLHPTLGFAQGFDRFDAWDEPDSEHEVGWVFDSARRWLETNRNRRFVLFVHTYETHAPHRRREPHFSRLAGQAGVRPADFELDLVTRPWEGLVAGGDRFTVRRPGEDRWTDELTADELETIGLMYDSAVATVDAEVGGLLDHLDSLGLSENTIVVLTSDHGEALGEDGRAGHVYLDDYNLMVPLIIADPGRSGAGRVVDDQVRLIDLMPTLLEAAGLAPATPIDGRSLGPLLSGEGDPVPRNAWAYAASSNRGLALRVDNQVKYVFPDPAWAEVAPRERLHDLVEDPCEDHNLAPADARLPDLRAIAKKTILAQHRGLRLEIVNASEAPLRGRLTGAWAAHNRVKTAEHDRARVHWTAGGGASFDVERGDRAILLFTRLASTAAGIEIRGSAGDNPVIPPGTIDLDLGSLSTPAVICLAAGRWSLDEGCDPNPETGFVLTRIGHDVSIVEDGLTLDAGVVEQLEALGYLD